MSNYRLNTQIAPQCTAFFKGLSEVIPERFLRMFNQAELRMLVGMSSLLANRFSSSLLTCCFLSGGIDAPIDVADLKANTVYGEFVGEDTDETIMNFWSVVEEFDKDDRSKLVKFVSAGFGWIQYRFALLI